MRIDNDFFSIDKISSSLASEYALPEDKIVRKGKLKDGVYSMNEYKFRLKAPGYVAAIALITTAIITLNRTLLK